MILALWIGCRHRSGTRQLLVSVAGTVHMKTCCQRCMVRPPPEPSDVHDDFPRACFMPPLGRFKEGFWNQDKLRVGARMHPCSPDAGAIFRLCNATTVCSPDFPRPWVPVPRFFYQR